MADPNSWLQPAQLRFWPMSHPTQRDAPLLASVVLPSDPPHELHIDSRLPEEDSNLTKHLPDHIALTCLPRTRREPRCRHHPGSGCCCTSRASRHNGRVTCYPSRSYQFAVSTSSFNRLAYKSSRKGNTDSATPRSTFRRCEGTSHRQRVSATAKDASRVLARHANSAAPRNKPICIHSARFLPSPRELF